MRTARIAVAGLAVALGLGMLTAAQSAGGAAAGAGSKPNVGSFHNPRANPYFPLTPGTVLVYRGTEDGEHFRERLTITHRTKTILGVRTTVVTDILRRADGSLAEQTEDWYAADHRGNVWYFGEATATFDENGRLESREGSWQAGVKGAVAGLIMPADPKPTDAYRQEFFAGHAEDQAWIVQNNAVVKVPLGTFHRVVRSFEWTRLESRVVSVKFYAAGLGIIREQDVAGGNEFFELVSVSHH